MSDFVQELMSLHTEKYNETLRKIMNRNKERHIEIGSEIILDIISFIMRTTNDFDSENIKKIKMLIKTHLDNDTRYPCCPPYESEQENKKDNKEFIKELIKLNISKKCYDCCFRKDKTCKTSLPKYLYVKEDLVNNINKKIRRKK